MGVDWSKVTKDTMLTISVNNLEQYQPKMGTNIIWYRMQQRWHMNPKLYNLSVWARLLFCILCGECVLKCNWFVSDLSQLVCALHAPRMCLVSDALVSLQKAQLIQVDFYTNERTNEHTNIQNGKNSDENKIIDSVIDYLNEKTGKQYKNIESNRKFIRARLSEGYTSDDLKKVIDIKNEDSNFDRKYMRPETLFNATKFQSYINEQSEISKPKISEAVKKHYEKEKLCQT